MLIAETKKVLIFEGFDQESVGLEGITIWVPATTRDLSRTASPPVDQLQSLQGVLNCLSWPLNPGSAGDDAEI